MSIQAFYVTLKYRTEHLQCMAYTTLVENTMNGGEDERGETLREHIKNDEVWIDTTNACDVRYNEGHDDSIVNDDDGGERKNDIRMTLLRKELEERVVGNKEIRMIMLSKENGQRVVGIGTNDEMQILSAGNNKN